MSAVRTLHTKGNLEIDIFVSWPSQDPAVCRELARIICQLTERCEETCRVRPVPQDVIDSLLMISQKGERIKAIQRLFGTSHYDEIFYPHDVVGHLYQLLCLAYPDARRICFGDAMGIVFQKKFRLGLLGLKPPTDQSNNSCRPDIAALILPVDQSGGFLEKVPLIVCRKDTVLEVIDECIQATPELQRYLRRLSKISRGRTRFLLLTENNAEAQFIDFRREIKMYIDLVVSQVEPNGVVFLKGHPGETLPRNEHLCHSLRGKVEVVELDKRFKRYPVELFGDFLDGCKVICMSYPTLSLKYLYNIDVVNPADESFIKKWFNDWAWDSYINGIDLYKKPCKALASWNTTSALWSGDAAQLSSRADKLE
jgi:hypothetical protein